MASSAQNRLQHLRLALAILAAALFPATAAAWDNVPFNTNTAAVMQGLLDGGPNRSCDLADNQETVFPGTFSFRNGNPGADHLYQAYTYYNNGPARCVQLQLIWSHQDCGDLEIGLGLYLGSFNPADPRQNLLAHSFESNYDFFDIGTAGHPNDYRHSPGFYRLAGFEYHLDDRMYVSAVVPALSTVVVVLDSPAQPGDDRQCPENPATSSLALLRWNLDDTPLEVEVHPTANYEFDPPGGATLDFFVSLSAQFADTFTVDYATADGTALAPGDYTAIPSGTLTFLPGETSKFVSVPITSDTVNEIPLSSETMTLTLANPSSPYVNLAQAAATGTIFDDDDDTGLCRITSALGNLPPGKVGVPYGPIDLRGFSAMFDPTLDYDWSTIGGLLPPGVSLGEVAVEDPPGSGNFELHGAIAGTPLEAGIFTFTVHLVCPVDDPDPGSPPPETFDAQLTIVIDPEAPQAILTLPDVAVVEGNSGLTPVPMTLQLSQALPTDLGLEVLLFDGSAAEADADYLQLLAVPQPTLVGAGNVAEPFALEVAGDLKVESDETFLVQIRTPISHQVLATATVTILNDDTANIVEVPTLGGLGLAALAFGLAGGAWVRLRRRPAS